MSLLALAAAAAAVAAQNCTAEWCCSEGSPEADCNVESAYLNTTSGLCECVCKAGWFLLPGVNETLSCPFCSGHGTSFDVVKKTCECEGNYIDNGPYKQCATCPARFEQTLCTSCNAKSANSSYPACNACDEDSFWNLENASCQPNSDCNVDYCYGSFEKDGSVTGATVANQTCSCQCKAGWFGEFGPITPVESAFIRALSGSPDIDVSYGACHYCHGRGTAFNSETKQCKCQDQWNEGSNCAYCPANYNQLTCDKCKVPRSDEDIHYTAYPQCERRDNTSTFNQKLFLEIFVPVTVFIILLTAWCCRRHRDSFDEFRPTMHSESSISAQADYRRIPSRAIEPKLSDMG